jgi:hypothetical protein
MKVNYTVLVFEFKFSPANVIVFGQENWLPNNGSYRGLVFCPQPIQQPGRYLCEHDHFTRLRLFVFRVQADSPRIILRFPIQSSSWRDRAC